jgi:transposase
MTISDSTNPNEELQRRNDALQAELSQRKKQIDAMAEEIGKKEREVARLKETLQSLLRRLYGQKAEKINPDQLRLFADDAAEESATPQPEAAADDEEAEPLPKKRRKRRSTKLKDLPRVRIEHDVDPEARVCGCCGNEKHKIGEVVTEEIEYVPASVIINEHVRPKYACRTCGDGVVIADLPPRLVDGGLPGPGLVAQIVTAKYGDHLPLYRQEAIFLRHGLELSRKTMCDWIRLAADLLQAIVMAMRKELLRRPVILADETPVLMRAGPNKKACQRAYVWVWLSPEEDLVIYEFHPTRAQSVVESFLDDFQGEAIVVDAYAGYNPCTKRGVKRGGCLAHARRYCREALASNPREASELVAYIQMLYVVERRAKELNLDERGILELRQRESVPLLGKLREAVDKLKPKALPQSLLGKALEYIDNQWPHLALFSEDGRVPIDNNASERAIKPVAIGRKNWLFAGSLNGGKSAATLYTLVQSCRRLRIDPFEYLRDVLGRVSTHPDSRIDELIPAAWKAARDAVKLPPVVVNPEG